MVKRVCNLEGCTLPPSTLVAPYIHRGYCSAEHKAWGQKILRLEDENKKFREALERIANEDYRGNRPQSAVIAYYALHPEEKL